MTFLLVPAEAEDVLGLSQNRMVVLIMFIPHALVNSPGNDNALNSKQKHNTNKAFQPKAHFRTEYFQRGINNSKHFASFH